MTHPAKLAALALQQLAKVLDKLTEDQLVELAEGRAEVEFRSREVTITSGPAKAPAGASRARAGTKTAATKAKVDVEASAAQIRDMATSEEVAAYLDAHDKAFTLAVLKEIARALGPTVAGGGSSKPAVKRNIVEGTAGFRERSQAVFARGW